MDEVIKKLEIKYKEAITNEDYKSAKLINDLRYELQFDLYQKELEGKRNIISIKSGLEEEKYNELINSKNKTIRNMEKKLENYMESAETVLELIRLKEKIQNKPGEEKKNG